MRGTLTQAVSATQRISTFYCSMSSKEFHLAFLLEQRYYTQCRKQNQDVRKIFFFFFFVCSLSLSLLPFLTVCFCFCFCFPVSMGVRYSQKEGTTSNSETQFAASYSFMGHLKFTYTREVLPNLHMSMRYPSSGGETPCCVISLKAISIHSVIFDHWFSCHTPL